MLTQLIDGLSGAIGSRYLPIHSQLLFTEYAGNLSVLDLIRPLVSTVSQGTTVLKGTWTFDCETGALGTAGGDVWWEQQTATVRRMSPHAGAKLVNLGNVPWSQVTYATLQTLTYDVTPIPGNDDPSNQLVDGDVFAVLTNAGNYAKVQVLHYGYDMTIRWATYRVGSRYRVLGTGYAQPEDVAATADESSAYVTERAGNLLRVSLGSANRASATVVAAGLHAPHQIWLDEANGSAYVVEFDAPGRLLRIDLASGTTTTLVTGLDHAIGLLVTADRQTAYVSEQAGGGRLTKITLASGARQVVVAGLPDPFFLTWADASEGRIFVTQRGSTRTLAAIDLTQSPAVVSAVVTGLPANPSSAAIVAADKVLVCCDAEIDELALPGLTLSSSAPLFMGIGKVPFDRIVSGLADTTVDPSYPYQFHQVPFGGTLPLLVNHQRAYEEGARYYRVLVDGARRYDGYTDYRWNAGLGRYEVRTQAALSIGAAGGGHYPVHSAAEAFLWLSPALGLRLDSRGLSDSMHTIVIQFTNALGTMVAASPPLAILVNNQSCIATIGLPTLGGVAADPTCGTLRYAGSPAGTVVMPFTVSHPAGFATYSFSLIKGVNPLTPPSQGGMVAGAPTQITAAVSTLLGPCSAPPGVAGFAERVYVAATTINGEGRQSQYDASAAIAFVLAP